MLLLSTSADDERRAKILADVEAAIGNGGGSIERNDDWGTRGMAYRISHEAEAEYHLLQFGAPPALLESLSQSLRIADGVLRFRIIKVLPGTPEPPASAPPVIAAVAPSPSTAAPSPSTAAPSPATAAPSPASPSPAPAAPPPPASAPEAPAPAPEATPPDE
jgi:small subunit ribosomal protein S6